MVLAISENVAAPEMVVVDVLVLPPIVNFPNVFVPATKVRAVVVLSERMISAVPETMPVKDVFHALPEPVIVQDALPRFIPDALDAANSKTVTAYVFALKLAELIVSRPVEFKADPRLKVLETLKQLIAGNVAPAGVIVCVDLPKKLKLNKEIVTPEPFMKSP